ncbi:hypothetical protein C2845_PM02G42760 [Panicum miliaceum]|uniref:Uncharacterized protein n=1 Tax=Panicum miliaceum TaxID=4540 RepID=A0A3L6S991_PANMI|nr:hypothetical protein C2845_PM02G42760 [Panicum miliaceum]
MVGSDVPAGSPGAVPGSPEHSRKRKSVSAAAEEDAASASASTRRATRSSASALVDVDGTMAWARRAATGALWAVRGRNCGIVDDDGRLAVILALRHSRTEEVDPDEPGTPYSKCEICGCLDGNWFVCNSASFTSHKQKRLHKGTRSSGRIAGDLNHLSSFLVSTRKRIGMDPIMHQAAVPEWVNVPSEEDKAEYRDDNETLQKMGTVVRLPPIVEPRKTRKAVDDKCKCSHPGSEACAGVHVKEAWKRVKYQLGDHAFRNCGFDAMGERVLKLWTPEDKKKLADIEKSVPQNNHEDFMRIALKQFKSERTMDLANLPDRSDGGRRGGAAWNARRPGGAAAAAAAAAAARGAAERRAQLRRPEVETGSPTCSAVAWHGGVQPPGRTAAPSTAGGRPVGNSRGAGATEGPTLSGGALAQTFKREPRPADRRSGDPTACIA